MFVFLCEELFSTHHDEAGVVPVPPAEGWHADFRVLVVMENLASTVGVSTEDEAGLKPPQQLRRGEFDSVMSSHLILLIILIVTGNHYFN